ncbi:MAG: acyltransferase family protein [Candidatus Kryptoniota bacterium]
MTDSTGATANVSSVNKDRLVSLDVFRGITIAAMILVNNAGDWSHVYPPLLHAEWNGWTPTDLIFPFFLFIMGVAMPYSFAKRLALGQGKGKLLKHVIIRSVIIFALGMFLSGIPNFNYSHRLILNILQRIGIIYLFSGAVYLYTDVRGQAVVGVLLIVLYWLAMFLIPVPGYGSGVLTPVGNLWWYVDEILLRGWHQHLFYVGQWKLEHAEGILSLIPSVSTVLSGVLTGHYLRSDRSKIEKASGMMVYGNFGLFIGIVMSIWFPINKLLWSSSYVVFTAGFALEVFGICYWLIDIKGIKWWSKPFMVFGTNAITSFFLSTLFALILDLVKIQNPSSGSQVIRISLKDYIYTLFFAPVGNPYIASLLYAIVYVLLWYIVMDIFYRRKIFIKI